MKGSCGKHDRVVQDLASRVKLWHPKSQVTPHFIYPFGEVDVLQAWIDEIFHFGVYEVKCNDNRYAREKAQEQLLRFESYLKRKFKKEEKVINSYYVYGCDGYYTVATLGSREGIEYKIGGGVNG